MNHHLRLLFFILFFYFTTGIKSQNTIEKEKIFSENINILYQNPNQTIKTANYLLETAKTNVQKAKALYLLSESQFILGNTILGTKNLFKAKQLLNKKDALKITALINISISERYRLAGIIDTSRDYIEKVKKPATPINTETMLISEKLAIGQAKLLVTSNKLDLAIERLKQTENYKNNKYPAITAITQNNIATLYLLNSDYDTAKLYFENALYTLKKARLENSSIAAISLNGLGEYYEAKDSIETSKSYYKQALSISYIDNNKRFLVNKNISNIYKKQDSIEISQKYYYDYIKLNTTLMNLEREERSILVYYIETNQEMVFADEKMSFVKLGIFLFLLFVISLLLFNLYNIKLNKKYKKFQEIISTVENENKIETPSNIEKPILKPSKRINIPLETEKAILERLKQFESGTMFTNSKINISVLAKKMNTNSKYISEIINTHKQKNFNTYINELRINHLIHLLNTDKKYLNYKVSSLAEEVGFSSHSAFTVVFKTITGITPKQLISFLKKNNRTKKH